MIKKMIIAFAVMSLAFAGAVYAADLQVGTEIEVVLSQKVLLEKGNDPTIARLASQHYDVTLEVKAGDRITITPKVGITKGTSTTDDADGSGDIVDISAIGWSIGGDIEANVYKVNIIDTNVNLVGGYRLSMVDSDRIDDCGIIADASKDTTTTTHEWEIGGGVSRDMSDLGMPVSTYVNVVYADINGKTVENNGGTGKTKISAVNHVGIRCGLTAEPKENLLLSINGKFVDQTAIVVSASILF